MNSEYCPFHVDYILRPVISVIVSHRQTCSRFYFKKRLKCLKDLLKQKEEDRGEDLLIGKSQASVSSSWLSWSVSVQDFKGRIPWFYSFITWGKGIVREMFSAYTAGMSLTYFLSLWSSTNGRSNAYKVRSLTCGQLSLLQSHERSDCFILWIRICSRIRSRTEDRLFILSTGQYLHKKEKLLESTEMSFWQPRDKKKWQDVCFPDNSLIVINEPLTLYAPWLNPVSLDNWLLLWFPFPWNCIKRSTP
jgi:hypothetical protein